MSGGGKKSKPAGGINVTLLVVHVNIIIYAMAFWLTQPVLPFLMKEHGADSLSFGIFQSLFNVVQLVGGLFVGDLQDRYSGSTALSITQLGSAAVYLLQFQATSLNMLYLSRLPTILQQSMQVAQACISKASDGDERTVSLGRLSLSYAVGMIGGSLISGRVAEAFGNKVPAMLAFALSVGICLINKFLLADLGSIKKDKKDEDGDASSKKNTNKAAAEEFLGPAGYFKLIMKLWKVVLFLAFLFSTRSLYEPVYNLTLLEQYEVGQSFNGTLMSVFAGLGVVSNVVILPGLLKFSSENTVTTSSIIGGALAFAALAAGSFSNALDLYSYLGTFAAISVCSSLLYILSTSYISKVVDKAAHGQAIALSHGLRSAVGIFCPLIGTYLQKTQGAWSVAALSSVVLVLAAFFHQRK